MTSNNSSQNTQQSAPPIQYPTRNYAAEFSENDARWYIGGKRCFMHCKNAALISVVVSFLFYVLLNTFFLIAFATHACYYTILIGSVFYVIFVFGYKQQRICMVATYICFLAMNTVATTGLVILGIVFLRKPSHAPLAGLHFEEKLAVEDPVNYGSGDRFAQDKLIYRIMIGFSVTSLCTTLISAVFLFYFIRYLFERTIRARHPRPPRGQSLWSQSSSEDRYGPLNTISYPPPCPPAYEVVDRISSTNGRAPKSRHPSNGTNPPQYTDFRTTVYADPPPYLEKCSSSDVV